MIKRNIILNSEQGSGSEISAKEFFRRTGVNPTGFLDHYENLQMGARSKSVKFWQRLKEGVSFQGVLQARTNKKTGIDYCWIELNLFRGKEPYYVVLFTPKMFDFLVDYQEGRVAIGFTLQELLDEAAELEQLEFNGGSGN